ncbi:tannase/feruloyl esterase family alpha/beta hydrolase [Streptomyces sp. KR55]|uniref:tannase/feruloyl esterase family alpha/beta hydrolase n=1 Tax=Streptomyces sp. KR55 TaxID=3457425 RepID=UPI003FD29D75
MPWSDYAQGAAMGMEYYKSVVRTLGQKATDAFVRLYVSPGTDHRCGGTIDPSALDGDGKTAYGVGTSAGTANGVPRNVDWFGVLEDWSFHGKAPGSAIVATANNYAPPFQVLATKPICIYPQYPRYTTGDAASANSYRCVGHR